MAPREDKPYSYAKEVEFVYERVGLLNFRARVKSPKRSEKDIVTRGACPHCHAADPKAPAAVLTTDQKCETHGVIERGTEVKAAKDGDVFVVVGSKQDVIDAKKPDPDSKDLVRFVDKFADEVMVGTFPIEQPFVLEPERPSEAFDALLSMLDADGTFVGDDGQARMLITEAFIGRSTSQRFYRLATWNGQLCLQEMIRPEMVHDFEPRQPMVDEKTVNMVKMLMTQDTDTFDRKVYESDAKGRLKDFLEARKSGADVVVPISAGKTAAPAAGTSLADSLAALLKAS